MTEARLKLAKRDAIVMHPGPIIRGLELTAEVADGPQSVIVDEVHNGVPTRMAILARAMGKAATNDSQLYAQAWPFCRHHMI